MKEWLFNIGLERWVHVLACFVISHFVAMLDVAECCHSYDEAACIGAIVAFLIGLLKEIALYVLLEQRHFSFKNLLADFVGSVFGFLFVWIVWSLWNFY